MDFKTIITLVIVTIIVLLIIIFLYLFIKMLLTSKGTSKKEVTRIEKEIIKEETIKSSVVSEKTYNEELVDNLKDKEYKDDEINKVMALKLKDLLVIKSTNIHYSSDFIINLITEKVTENLVYELRNDVYGYNVPVNKTVNHNSEHIDSYLASLQGVESSSQTGKKLATFKYNGKSFALVSASEDNKYKVTLKCGPRYAKKIMELYPGKVAKAQFPHGLIWFTVTDEISLELTKSLIEISYTIAKAGY